MLATALLFTSPAISETLQGQVVGVSDGDTVTILDASNTQWKIRLMGIDAPEKRQAFGNKSKQHLSDLVFNKQVEVEYSKKDKYGRTVGRITVEGIDANFEQVKVGMAWHYKKYQGEQTTDNRASYAHAEELARAEKRGLWVDPESKPPWEWRQQQKKKKYTAAQKLPTLN